MKLVPLFIPFVAALALAACGDGAAPDATAAGQPDDEAELAFARCMREEGFDFPDPGAAGSGERRIEIRRGTSPEKLRTATETCRKKTGGGPQPLSEEEQAEFRDAALKFARCMRAEGIDIPDPQVGAGGAIVRRRPGAGGGGPDPSSAAFQRAEKACEDLRPQRRGGGPAVGRSSGGGGGGSVAAEPAN